MWCRWVAISKLFNMTGLIVNDVFFSFSEFDSENLFSFWFWFPFFHSFGGIYHHTCNSNTTRQKKLTRSDMYSQGNLSTYNHFHNIMRLFDVLPIFLSPQVKRCPIITYKQGIYKLPHMLPNDLALRKLGNMRKVSKLLRMVA